MPDVIDETAAYLKPVPVSNWRPARSQQAKAAPLEEETHRQHFGDDGEAIVKFVDHHSCRHILDPRCVTPSLIAAEIQTPGSTDVQVITAKPGQVIVTVIARRPESK